MIAETYKRNVQRALEYQGLGPAEVSRRLGKPRFVDHLLNPTGRATDLRLSNALALAETLGYGLDELCRSDFDPARESRECRAPTQAARIDAREFGDRLREIRRQRQIAGSRKLDFLRRAKISAARYDEIELGAALPTWPELLKLGELLKVSAAEMLFGVTAPGDPTAPDRRPFSLETAAPERRDTPLMDALAGD